MRLDAKSMSMEGWRKGQSELDLMLFKKTCDLRSIRASGYNLCVTTSLFDLYKIGVGPSSSHTMGPMRAACRFARGLAEHGTSAQVERVQAQLFGSLALTGLGHGTDRAVLLGLAGNEPSTIDPAEIASTIASIREMHRLCLAGERSIPFEEIRDLVFNRSTMYPPGARTQHP